MKKAHIIIFIIGISFNSFCQNRLSIIVGPTVGGSKSQNLDTLFTTYNNYYSSKMSNGFNQSFNPSGFTFLGSYSGAYGVMEANVGYGQVWGGNTFTYSNGDKRVVKFTQREYITDLTVGTNEDSPVYFHVNLGVTFRSSATQIYYKHANGIKEYNIMIMKDYSRDYLNGLYESWRLSFYTGFGIGANINDEGLKLVLRGDYNFRGGSFLGGSHTDYQSAKFGIGVSQEYLPFNYQIYNDNPNFVNNISKNDTYGMRWTLALTIPLIDF